MIRKGRYRTVLLAVAACCALFWGAIDIVGVPVRDLLVDLVWVIFGVGALVGLAGLTGWLLNRLKPKRIR
jgi:hypothetical protein